MTFREQNDWIRNNLTTMPRKKLDDLLECYRKHNYHGIYGSEVNKGKDYSAYKTMIEVLLGERRRRNR